MKKFKVFIALFIGLLFVGLTAIAQEQNPRLKPPRSMEVSAEQAQPAQQKPAEQTEQSKVGEQAKPEDEKELQKKFEEELAKYGKWVDDPEYGKVWVPNDSEKEDWKPYQDGKWQDYDDGCNYWFSYEPFGYIAYHYGRWQWCSIWGWYWIPTYAWGPGWVNWYYYNNYYAWYPMWYGSGYYDYYNRNSSRLHNRGWTVVRSDQLRNPNISHVAMRGAEVQRALPQTVLAHNLSTKAPTISRNNQTMIQRSGNPNRNIQGFPSRIGSNQARFSPLRSSSRPSVSRFNSRSTYGIRSFSRNNSPSSRTFGSSRSHTPNRQSAPSRSYSAPSRSSASPRVSSGSRSSGTIRRRG